MQGLVATKLKRCHVTAFNVDEDLAASFKLPKARSDGEFFGIQFMHAAFDRDAFSGEFFIGFSDMVYDNKIKEAFEKMGAGCVFVSSFAANDDNASASAALARVWEAADKNGNEYTKGECEKALRQRTEARMEAEKEKALAKEFQEKSVAAINNSLSEVGGKVDGVVTTVVDINVNVIAVKDIVTQKNVLEVSVDNELKLTKAKLVHATLKLDQEENKRGMITQDVNKHKRTIRGLEGELRAAKAARLEDKTTIAIKDEKIEDCIANAEAKDEMMVTLVAAHEKTIADKDEIIALQRALLRSSGVQL